MRCELSCFGRLTEWVDRLEWYAVVPMGVLALTLYVGPAHARDAATESPWVMQTRIDKLEAEVAELKAIVQQLQSASPKLTTAAVMSAPSALPAVSTPVTESSGIAAPVSASVVSQKQSKQQCQTNRRSKDPRFLPRHDDQSRTGHLLRLQFQPARRSSELVARLRCSQQRIQLGHSRHGLVVGPEGRCVVSGSLVRFRSLSVTGGQR